MEMQTVAIGVGLFVLGFLVGRLTAPKERSTVVYNPIGGRGDLQSKNAREIGAAYPEIEAAIRAGRKIEAIKLYREAFGTDLKGAKDAVEALEARLGDTTA
jgi:ribosomal protein L7/L12